jgi:hypothetical protein
MPIVYLLSEMLFKKNENNSYKRDMSYDEELDLHVKGHFTRHSLELRELEVQSREYQRLAEKLLREGEITAVNEVNRKRAKCMERISELREIVLKLQAS